ncbi:MinD/ParA family ATP-binding protein [Nocardioides sp. Leaf285]|uniref:MinD/ParA family ATP-binding protein n=1 Tax=Nocardioides sp. Leaf285 TaxID=1736322 RepID=UPI001F25D86B|nr:hypothetical protein [Nocardioides sp. Leaf285]
MTQPQPHDPRPAIQPEPPPRSRPESADASDRLHRPEDLAAHAADRAPASDRSGPPPGDGAPVTDHLADPLGDPLTDPVADPLADPLATPSDPSAGPVRDADRPPACPPPAVGPPQWTPTSPPPAPLATSPAPPPSSPPAGPPAGPQAGPAPTVAPTAPPATAGEAGAGGAPAQPRRFMSATDFLDRRADVADHGPATWGWRGRVRRWSGGLLSPAMGRAEAAHERDRAAVQRELSGPRTIAFVNPKGGAAKTTGVLAAGYTFGTVRGGGVVAWDNNETRGTLGIRGTRGHHRNTTRELLGDLGRFDDVAQSRIGDLGSYVRTQGDAHFDVLASDERADVTGTIRADDFAAVHGLLERFYRILLVDTGNNMRAENWLAAAAAADLLVVTSTVREDTGYSGLWMLDALQDAGHPDLKHKTVTVLSDPSPKVDAALARDLVDVYEQRTRAVYRVPYDPALVSGSVVPYARLSQETRRAWLTACAGMAATL